MISTYDAFERGWNAGQNQLVYARLAADLDTPVSLMLKLGEARADTFMLESVTGGELRGRYSVVGMKPDLIWFAGARRPRSTARPALIRPPSPRWRGTRWTRCAPFWPNVASTCPRICLPLPPACLAIWAMT